MAFSFGDDPFEAGQSTSVQCMVSSGDLPLNIEWLFNEQSVVSGMGLSTVKISQRGVALNIDFVSAKHAGNYTCIGRNAAGDASYTAQFFVNGLSTQL